MMNESYLDVLNKIYTKRTPIKTIEPDKLTIALTQVSVFNASDLYDFNQHIQENDLAIPSTYYTPINLFDVDFNLNNIGSFIDALEEKEIDQNVIKGLKNFSTKYDCTDKSVLSILWANIINNSISKKSDNNQTLIDLFFAICEDEDIASRQSIAQLQNDMIDFFNSPEEKQNLINYFNLVYSQNIKAIDDGGLQRYGQSLAPIEIDSTELKDVQINNNKELFDALSKIETLPSALNYIQNNLLNNEKDDKIRYYKALFMTLKITNDPKFIEQYKDMDRNTIGFNLANELYGYEMTIRTRASNITPKQMVTFQNEASKVANIVLGKDTSNVFGVWKKVVNSYIKQCTVVARRVKNNDLTPSVRKYLKALGIIKERELIKDNSKLMAGLKNKSDDARKLLSYLSDKKLVELGTDPFIDNAEKLYDELSNWALSVKNIYPRPMKLAHLDIKNLSPILKEMTAVAKRQPQTIIDKPTQLTLNDYVDFAETEKE